ncbi:hypothetical protein M011DRAFT_411839 [Sporormia fimetaria CBS 119925]|uniref:EthD domain-containing protein n=1 Tax=Sporormia fimetaria CBS 119925 TaxID=1340428 RepID=A0A6A6UYL5_9PLEO|nr:hypothetical protein M011DRAFT_411839 [Sporormia fimetaria CBS 119925]
MTFKVLLFIYRKPSISVDEFKHLYETSHISSVRSLVGDLFPISHTRNYIAEEGRPSSIQYDALTEMLFQDRASFEIFSAKLMEGENGAKIGQDCEQFMDTQKTSMVVVSDVKTTSRNDSG